MNFKDDLNFVVGRWSWLRNCGQFPSVWLDASTMLEFPMQWPELDGILVHTDWVSWKTFSSLYLQRGYQL
jgi:hypothetical protein